MQILSTKLFMPPLRPRLVSRSRLIQKLNQGMECGFVLVSAPAGYGKSTLLSAWLSQVGAASAWLTLDDRDNDPARFLAYLAAALRVINPAIEAEVETLPELLLEDDVETRLTPLINQLAEIVQPCCLVLDDYHTIQNQAVHQLVSFLLQHRPAPLRLFIATRADPPLPLARLRARSEMVELRLADLRFTLQETADFFNHTMGLSLTPEDAASITVRTEGWIAGLQMAALSMQNTEDVSGFITTLTGSHHYIFDYLLEEILERQSPEIRRFLLHTSILEQLTAPLCDALLQEQAGASATRPSTVILEALGHANLFITPLDQARHLYRYHPLFADLLRGNLQQKNPELVPMLHTRASAWFEGQGLIAEAIRHALAAGDWESVLRMISANVFALLDQNELTNVARQLDRVTRDQKSASPWVWIGRAWLAAYTGQWSAVDPYLNLVEAEIRRQDPAVQPALGGQSAAIRAFVAWIEGREDSATQAARQALELLPATDYLIRCQAATILGLSMSDLEARARAFDQALAYAREIPVSSVTIFAHGCWTYLLFSQGKLRQAHAACYEAMRLAQSSSTHQPIPTLSYVYGSLSLVLYEWNDLEGSVRYAREAVALARRWEQADALHFALTCLGSALFASGDVEGAFELVRQAWQVAQRTSAWFEEITIVQEAGWHLAQDNLEAALGRLQGAQIDIEDQSRTYLTSLVVLLSARIYLAQKRYTQALTVLTISIDDLEKITSIYQLVSTLCYQALAYQGIGQEAQALASLRKALTYAAPEGFLRSFIEIGAALIPVLRQARAARIMPEPVDKILACLEGTGTPQPDRTGAAPGLIEQLSEREMEVLKLLAQGCSDKKIAESLVIARETVHKHLKNIYGKLDVHSRTEAIVRARALALL